jgi:hypothetical protein
MNVAFPSTICVSDKIKAPNNVNAFETNPYFGLLWMFNLIWNV